MPRQGAQGSRKALPELHIRDHRTSQGPFQVACPSLPLSCLASWDGLAASSLFPGAPSLGTGLSPSPYNTPWAGSVVPILQVGTLRLREVS